MTRKSTLSQRGKEIANASHNRDKYKMIMKNPYDPDTNPDGFVNIGIAENYAMLPEVAKFVNEHFSIQAKELSYYEGPWGNHRLREAMAKHITRTFEAIEPVDPEDILFANGVTSICEMLGFTICNEGDGVLFGTPIYHAFKIDFETKAKIHSVLADFGDVDQFSLDAIPKYEEAIVQSERAGVKVRAMMLCNPHNPLGRCYPKDTIIGIMKLCDKYKIHLLSDEIYASSVYDVPDSKAEPFTSVLSFDHSKYISADLIHVIYGMSKDFGCGGIRLGCILMRNKELMRAMSGCTQFHWAGNPSQTIATQMLEDEPWLDTFLKLGRERLAARNKLTRELLDEAGVKFHRGANAGFFIWIDLRPYLPDSKGYSNQWDRELALVKKLVDHKVFLTNGQDLHAPEPGWFRVIFSQDERTIRAGLARVFKALGIEEKP